jgi:hypothetical protein
MVKPADGWASGPGSAPKGKRCNMSEGLDIGPNQIVANRDWQFAFRKGGRGIVAWAGRCLWLAVRTAVRAVKIANHEQVHMWESVLLTSGAAPLSAAGPLRWIPSLDGYRLVGSHLPAQSQDLSETGR